MSKLENSRFSKFQLDYFYLTLRSRRERAVRLDIGADSKRALRQIAELQQIEEAMEKIKKGSFGCCTLCSNEIPVSRLQIFPEAPVCPDCDTGAVVTNCPAALNVESHPYA